MALNSQTSMLRNMKIFLRSKVSSFKLPLRFMRKFIRLIILSTVLVMLNGRVKGSVFKEYTKVQVTAMFNTLSTSLLVGAGGGVDYMII